MNAKWKHKENSFQFSSQRNLLRASTKSLCSQIKSRRTARSVINIVHYFLVSVRFWTIPNILDSHRSEYKKQMCNRDGVLNTIIVLRVNLILWTTVPLSEQLLFSKSCSG